MQAKKISGRYPPAFAALLFLLVGSASVLDGNAKATEVADAGSELADIIISYKLDPRLTSSLYMGERWVSPAKYSSTLQTGGHVIIDARAYGKSTKGISMAINPEWKATNPDMVAVTPGQGGTVSIKVTRTGKSRLNVSWKGFSKELHVEAVDVGDGLQVFITY